MWWRSAYHKLAKRRQDHASRAHAKFARVPRPACSEWDPFPSRVKKKTSPLHYPNPSLGCGQPAPPLQCWRLRNTVLTQFARMPMPACSDWDSFPSRAKKTSPLNYPNPSLGCGQQAPPMHCWRLRKTVLKQEWNDFSHRETCPHFGTACNQHCIDWGCGGAAR